MSQYIIFEEDKLKEEMYDKLNSTSLSWTERAEIIIDYQIKIIQLRESNPTDKEIEKFCRKNYPFGERNYWPYKAWLKVMRKKFSKPTPNPNQLTLPI